MPNNNSRANWIEQAQKHWGAVAQGGTWVLGIVGGFLLPPPLGTDDNHVWLKLAEFVAAVSVGLLFLPSRRWGKKKHAKWWWLVAALSLVISIVSFFGYQRLTYSSTCVTVDGARVVIGKDYTPHGTEYIHDNPGISCTDLIDQHVGVVEDVWTKQSIDSARLKLAATYIACLPLFTLCIMSLVHAMYCATRNS